MVDDIVLYDLASKGRRHCWSNNTWKVRLVLNYKGERIGQIMREKLTFAGIPYRTEFMEYPDITPPLKAFGIAPHEDNDPPYTIPAIKIGNKYLMDSTVIVEELERRYPKPSLKLDAPSGRCDGPCSGSFEAGRYLLGYERLC
jgi:glutathione S-transferase